MSTRSITWTSVVGFRFAAYLVLLACMGLNTASLAAVPELIDYQGKVTTSDGTPLNGDYPIQFSIYADSTGGVALWTESHTSVSVSEGLFHVFLGSVADLPDTLFDEADRWLGINVDSDGEMSPRIRIGSVPYALKSGDVILNSIRTI